MELAFVLGGGGYAYSPDAMTTGGARTAPEAVDGWLDDLSPLLSYAPFVPVFGDTESLSPLHEESPEIYNELSPSLTGDDAPLGTYSFDVGSVHYAGLNAPHVGAIYPGLEEGARQLEWLDADLADARERGQRFIIVSMHLDTYSSETNRPDMGTTRDALVEIFDRHRVSVVFSGDGVSYERSHKMQDHDLGIFKPGAGRYKGVTYVRAGSGGRTDFGDWKSESRPFWSAVRNNGDGVAITFRANAFSLRVYAWSFPTGGGPPQLLDMFALFK